MYVGCGRTSGHGLAGTDRDRRIVRTAGDGAGKIRSGPVSVNKTGGRNAAFWTLRDPGCNLLCHNGYE